MFNYTRKVKACWPYAATKTDELSFLDDAIILVLNENPDEFGDWAEGQLEKDPSMIGWFPLGYVEDYEEQPSATEIRAGEIYRLSVDEDVSPEARAAVVDTLLHRVYGCTTRLEFFLKRFAPPVKTMVGMTEKEKRILFGNAFLLAALLDKLYTQLSKIADADPADQGFGSCLLRAFAEFGSTVHKYFIAHPVTLNVYTRLQRENRAFVSLVASEPVLVHFLEPEEISIFDKYKNISFTSFLYLPFEFMTLFAKDLKELSLVTVNHHTDKKAINAAVKLYSRLEKRVFRSNELIKFERSVLGAYQEIEKFPSGLIDQLGPLQHYLRACTAAKKKDFGEAILMVYRGCILVLKPTANQHHPHYGGGGPGAAFLAADGHASHSGRGSTTSVSSLGTDTHLGSGFAYSLRFRILTNQLGISPPPQDVLAEFPYAISLTQASRPCLQVYPNTEREKYELVSAIEACLGLSAAGNSRQSPVSDEPWLDSLIQEAEKLCL